MTCKDMDDNILLHFYGELASDQHVAFEAHLNRCERCRASAEEVRRLHQLLGNRPVREPSADLVLRSRLGLDDALDHDEFGWRGVLRGWSLGPTVFPAMRTATLLALLISGFGLGWALRPLSPRTPPAPAGYNAASLGDADLDGLRINGVTRVADAKTGDARVRLDGERRVTLEGSLDDPHIQQILVNTVKSYENAGIRRDTLDALRGSSEKQPVRRAMVYAMGHDPNAGVRLAALKAVQEAGWDSEARQGFIDALQRDSNLGVRVAAIDMLSKHPDEEVLPVLKRLAADDPSAYVRMKCAGAVRGSVGDDFEK